MDVVTGLYAIPLNYSLAHQGGIRLKRTVESYLWISDKTTVLVDAGVVGTEAAFERALQAVGRCVQDIDIILVTHADPDHIGLLATFQRASGCEIWCHPAAQGVIEDLAGAGQARFGRRHLSLVAGSATVTRLLYVGERFTEIGPEPMEVLYTPGHTSDSCSFWLPESRAALTGDLLSMATGFPVYDDVLACRHSFAALAALQPEFLFNSWERPRQGSAIATVFTEAQDCLDRVHAAVQAAWSEHPKADEEVICQQVAEQFLWPLWLRRHHGRRAVQGHLAILQRGSG